jgi:hypothetical protein
MIRGLDRLGYTCTTAHDSTAGTLKPLLIAD